MMLSISGELQPSVIWNSQHCYRVTNTTCAWRCLTWQFSSLWNIACTFHRFAEENYDLLPWIIPTKFFQWICIVVARNQALELGWQKTGMLVFGNLRWIQASLLDGKMWGCFNSPPEALVARRYIFKCTGLLRSTLESLPLCWHFSRRWMIWAVPMEKDTWHSIENVDGHKMFVTSRSPPFEFKSTTTSLMIFHTSNVIYMYQIFISIQLRLSSVLHIL